MAELVASFKHQLVPAFGNSTDKTMEGLFQATKGSSRVSELGAASCLAQNAMQKLALGQLDSEQTAVVIISHPNLVKAAYPGAARSLDRSPSPSLLHSECSTRSEELFALDRCTLT